MKKFKYNKFNFYKINIKTMLFSYKIKLKHGYYELLLKNTMFCWSYSYSIFMDWILSYLGKSVIS